MKCLIKLSCSEISKLTSKKNRLSDFTTSVAYTDLEHSGYVMCLQNMYLEEICQQLKSLKADQTAVIE